MFNVPNGGLIMQLKKLTWAAVAILLTASLTSCNIGKSPEPTVDVNAVFTSAAGTMISQLNDQQTQTAAAVTPTPPSSPTSLDTFTPLPTFSLGPTPLGGTILIFSTPGLGVTPLAPTLPSSGNVTNGMAVGCNNAELIGEKPPDGTIIHPAKQFDKSFSLQNTGTCRWDEGYSFDFKSGDQMQGDNVTITKQSNSGDFTAPGHSQSFVLHLWAPGTAGEYKGYWQMKGDDGQWFGSLVWVDIVVHR
jgi:hypothetical protein